MNTEPQQKSRAVFSSLLLLGASLALVAAATPAAAHTCISESHTACNAHDCPDDGKVHNHEHNVHWWRNHSCSSAPSSCSATAGTTEDLIDITVNPVIDTPSACVSVPAIYVPDVGPVGPLDQFTGTMPPFPIEI